jgi:hypothetical protein
VAAKSTNVGGENPEFILREFQGMNVIDAREAINDNEFAWCENAIPQASGALYPVPAQLLAANVFAESGQPSYSMSFAALGVQYVFAVWSGTGNGYLVNISSGFTVTKIITGLTSGATFATQYANQGLLIIDPTGYWDWNVTTANVLTAQNNAVASFTNRVLTSVAGGTVLHQAVSVSGTGAAFQTQYEVVNVTLVSGGTGYAVGDTISLTDGNPTTPANIVVASISGGGATGPITGITLSTGGSYPGPSSATPIATGPTGGTTTTTGAGTGAAFTDHIQATGVTITARGTGYGTNDGLADETSVAGVVDSWVLVPSGIIGGTGIATYAGRVWISSGRTVYFTDINSYNSFGGVGGSFFISDSYLFNNITALIAANNYLYIFGDTSIDALSNVTVAAGVTSFSRINVTGSVGCSIPSSIFPYYRALMFFNASGIYLLAGATPEKVSEKITNLVNAVQLTGAFCVNGAQVLVRGELCAAFSVSFNDTFTRTGAIRSILVLYFRGRWWVYSMIESLNIYGVVSTILTTGAVATGFAWAGNALYQILAGNLSLWLLKTKLWDGGAPTREKQSINAAIGGTWAGLSPTGVTINVDTELGTQIAVKTPVEVEPAGYQFAVTAANEGGSQYLGLTVRGSAGMTQINMLALRGKTERDMLQ